MKALYSLTILAVSIVLAGILVLHTLPSFADEIEGDAEMTTSNTGGNNMRNCPMKGDSNLGVNFSETEKDIALVKTMIDGKIAEIKALAAQSGITSIDMQSMNYSVNASASGTRKKCTAGSEETPEELSYQIYGNFNWKLEPEDKILPFLEILVAKGYNANINVNSYKRCQ